MLRVAVGLLLAWACEGNGGEVLWDYGTSDDAQTECTASARCGQNKWNVVPGAEACAGGEQSPINATFLTAVPYTNASATLTMISRPCPEADFLINAHTAEVSYETCGEKSEASWQGKNFLLHQFHYHSPSEHMVDGKYYPMEAHHVHVNPADGTALVIAVFMYVNPSLTRESCITESVECTRAKFFDDVLTLGKGAHTDTVETKHKAALEVVKTAALPGPTGIVSAETVSNDAYGSFIPPMTQPGEFFYHYLGSFTTPPCTIGTTWLLNPTPVGIFDATLQFYRELINALKENQLVVPPVVSGVCPPGYVVQEQGCAPELRAPIAGGSVTWKLDLGNNNRGICPLGERKFYKVILPGAAAPGVPPVPAGVTVTTTGNGVVDSSPSSYSGGSLESLASSSGSSESDSGSKGLSGSTKSGSSGSYMSIWKWGFLMLLCLCCCTAALAAIHGKPNKKKPAKKAAKSSKSDKSKDKEKKEKPSQAAPNSARELQPASAPASAPRQSPTPEHLEAGHSEALENQPFLQMPSMLLPTPSIFQRATQMLPSTTVFPRTTSYSPAPNPVTTTYAQYSASPAATTSYAPATTSFAPATTSYTPATTAASPSFAAQTVSSSPLATTATTSYPPAAATSASSTYTRYTQGAVL